MMLKFQCFRFWTSLLIGLLMVSTAFAQTDREQWQALNTQMLEAYQQGDYAVGIPLAEQARELALKNFGLKDSDTLTSLSNLASLYQAQGLYREAEPLFKQVLALSREVQGEQDPETLISLNNLAGLYSSQGKYREAETRYRQSLALHRKVLGERHPNTLSSLSNLSVTLYEQGHYGEAEPLAVQALQLRLEVLGERDPSTLTSMNNLAALNVSQGRYEEAEKLYQQALKLYREVLGERHPDTLNTLTNLVMLFVMQKRYAEGEPLAVQVLELSRSVHGERHPSTIANINNLAGLYQGQNRFEEAEPLLEQALTLYRQLFGEQHPRTLTSLFNKAMLYSNQGRLKEAESLFEQTLSSRREILGEHHTDTLSTLQEFAGFLPTVNKPHESIRLMYQLEQGVQNHLSVELYSTEEIGVRRAMSASTSTFQNLALSLAIAFPIEAGAERVAAIGVLRFKGLLAEEEAYMARLSRRSQDPRVQSAANELSAVRQQLTSNYHGSAEPDVLKALLRSVNKAELALGRLSRDYADHLQVKTASVDELQIKLPADSALVEYRRYHRIEFGGGYAEERWAAVIFEGMGSIRVVDLGAIEQTPEEIRIVMANVAGTEVAAHSLHQRLIGQLDLPRRITRLYFAPDDVLHLLPFHQLIDEAGVYLGERFELRQLQSARDLLRTEHDQPASGLLALGGIDFGVMTADNASPASDTAQRSDEQTNALRSITAKTFRNGFSTLINTGSEVHTIEQLYRQARPEERTEIWQATEATEARLKGLKAPPRVLHLATHGFYRAARHVTDRPMLLAGITLTGANQALSGEAENGILYALEAQDLNLNGTELVVLSACETAQGQIVDGAGIYGLVRALRTAGARNVLVTLRPIGDASAPQFMKRFYTNWLYQPKGRSDPTQALQDTQAYYMKNEPTFDWLPYIIVGS